ADELTERERAVPAAHQRNRAERTAVVASLAHFEIAHVRQVAREEPYTRMYHRSVFDEAALVRRRNYAIDLCRTQKEVDFRQCVDQLVLVALHHAADADDGQAGAVRVGTARFHARAGELHLR